LANLFADGFEGGNLNAWSSAVTDGGHLSAAVAAKLHGSYGLSCYIADTTSMYVQDNTPTAETRYRCRFYIDPNNLAMSNNDDFLVFGSICVDATGCHYLFLKYTTAAGYSIYVVGIKDNTEWSYTGNYVITDAPHCIEIDCKISSGVGQNNGTIELLIDGVSKETLTGLDNDTKAIDIIKLGAISYIDAGTSGTLFLDDFNSNNDGALIGMIINTAAIVGVTAPVTRAIPVTTITETDQYTGTVAWNGSPTTFAGGTIYTATITLTPKTGYTLTGVIANFFTVAGATATNDANSGAVTAVFPATANITSIAVID
jgi:hypothetical protein